MTIYSQWPSWAARLLLLLGLGLVLMEAVPHARPQLVHLGPAGYDDRYFQRSLANRVANGEDYYAAAASQSRTDSYPTTPPQVFREPALTWFLALFKAQPVRRAALLFLLAIATVAMRERFDASSIPKRLRFLAMIAQVSGFAIAWHSLQVYQHEVWAALLMAISLALYRPDRYLPSIALALLACLVRELALPYMLAMGAFAVWEGRWREAGAWAGGMAIFLAVYALHLHTASGLYRPGDLASSGWLYASGWDFVVETAKKNEILFYSPNWLVASAIWLGMIGLAGWCDPWTRRIALIVGGYLGAFLLVGRPDNQYWGYLYSPLLPLGWVLAPAALFDLMRRALPVRAQAALLSRTGHAFLQRWYT